jgi:hypothetical protein
MPPPLEPSRKRRRLDTDKLQTIEETKRLALAYNELAMGYFALARHRGDGGKEQRAFRVMGEEFLEASTNLLKSSQPRGEYNQTRIDWHASELTRKLPSFHLSSEASSLSSSWIAPFLATSVSALPRAPSASSTPLLTAYSNGPAPAPAVVAPVRRDSKRTAPTRGATVYTANTITCTTNLEERHVALLHTKDGSIISGRKAPLAGGLCTFLEKNPDYLMFVPTQKDIIPAPPGFSYSEPMPKVHLNTFNHECGKRLVPLWNKNKRKRVDRDEWPRARNLVDHLKQNPHLIVHVADIDESTHCLPERDVIDLTDGGEMTSERNDTPRIVAPLVTPLVTPLVAPLALPAASSSLMMSGSSSSVHAETIPAMPFQSLCMSPVTIALSIARDPIARWIAYQIVTQFEEDQYRQFPPCLHAGELFVSNINSLFLYRQRQLLQPPSHPASLAIQLVADANPAPGSNGGSMSSTTSSYI